MNTKREQESRLCLADAQQEERGSGMALPPPGSSVHMVGIAGVGMNALAQVLRARGYRVTGSDRLTDTNLSAPVLDALQRQEIALYTQDGSGVTPETGALVVSTAIEQDNPDLEAARRRSVPVRHRSEMLSALIGGEHCIAVAGTSGKTTVTGMIGWLLSELGADPHVVNGAAVLNWKSTDCIGNVRMGASDLWVVEVDESDRSLLRFFPEHAVITNISRDHFTLEETTALFELFVQQVERTLICGAGLGSLFAGRNDLRAVCREAPPACEWTHPLPLPGAHNRENAQLAITLCEALGYEREAIVETLSRFKGVERRLERVDEGGDVAVYDDYAHNPAKIRATWNAVAEQAERVIGFWRPHGYGPLSAMMEDLCTMFQEVCRPGDRLYIPPVYYEGGTAEKRVDAEMFVERLKEHRVPATWISGYDAFLSAVLESGRPGDAVVCMGARDPELPQFARRLAARLASI